MSSKVTPPSTPASGASAKQPDSIPSVRSVIYRSVAGDGNSRPAVAPPDPSNPFIDIHGNPRVLRGVAIYSGSTRLAELAVRVGFDTIWIEMEHGPADFTQVEQLCMAIEAGGGIPTVRVPDGQRNHVLR